MHIISGSYFIIFLEIIKIALYFSFSFVILGYKLFIKTQEMHNIIEMLSEKLKYFVFNFYCDSRALTFSDWSWPFQPSFPFPFQIWMIYFAR